MCLTIRQIVNVHEDYQLVNQQTMSDLYAMPTLEEIFDVNGHAHVLST
jgi:hypothetical protein